MKPLSSPAVEYRAMGVLMLLGGAAFDVVAVAVASRPGALVVGSLFIAAFFGFGMYALTWGRWIRDAARKPREVPPDAKIASSSDTWHRVLRTDTWLLALFVLLAFAWGSPYIFAGVLLGDGVSLIVASHWIHRWEHEHHAQLLREARWRFNRDGRRGFARGRGRFDPRDFYVRHTSLG